jgi:hypothetical protein
MPWSTAREILENTETILSSLGELTGKVQAMSDAQAHLDTDIAALAAILTELETEITTLKGVPAGTPLSFAAADQLVADAQAAAAALAVPPPVTPPVPPAV